LLNKFPPKFSENILYPAIYNLDEYNIPSEYDYYEMGNYFNIAFGGYSVNDVPVLTFGKHKFDIIILPHGNDNPNPKLKNGSRILFEVKDNAGTIVWSDTTPIYNSDGFTGYIWIKQDPLRTYNDIQEGYGTLTVVAKTNNTSSNWRNRYNLRVTHDVYIKLYKDTNEQIVEENWSPIVMQRHTGSQGSGSGNLIISEGYDFVPGPDVEVAKLVVTSSKMKTYSGEIKHIVVDYKLSGSIQSGNPAPEFRNLGEWGLLSQSYEDNIYKNYGAGINPLSERFTIPIDHSQIPYNGWDGSGKNKVKFRLRFRNPNQEFAKDVYTTSSDYVLDYPKNDNEWLEFTGSEFVPEDGGPGSEGAGDPAETSNGQFSFLYEGHAVNRNATKGQTFKSTGRLKTSAQGESRQGAGGSTE